MTFSDAVATCFRKYADFSGRAKRAEYWWFALFLLLVGIACSIAEGLAGLSWGSSGWGPFSLLVNIAFFVPSLAVGARRLHDTGRSGWWQLLLIVPCAGIIALIVMWCLASDWDENKYGPARA